MKKLSDIFASVTSPVIKGVITDYKIAGKYRNHIDLTLHNGDKVRVSRYSIKGFEGDTELLGHICKYDGHKYEISGFALPLKTEAGAKAALYCRVKELPPPNPFNNH